MMNIEKLKIGDVVYGTTSKYDRFGNILDWYPRKITIVKITPCYIFFAWNKESLKYPSKLKKISSNDKFLNPNKLELLKFMLNYMSTQNETYRTKIVVKKIKLKIKNEENRILLEK